MSNSPLFHIVRADSYEAARADGEYLPEGYERDGFIHCSYQEQVVGVANHLYRGQEGLVLLEIRREALDSEVIDENLEGGDTLFPHIYGPLPTSAVAAIHALHARSDGTFELPASIRDRKA